MVSEFAVQAILKKCVNKIINIDPIDCFIVVCVFINLYINAIGYKIDALACFSRKIIHPNTGNAHKNSLLIHFYRLKF